MSENSKWIKREILLRKSYFKYFFRTNIHLHVKMKSKNPKKLNGKSFIFCIIIHILIIGKFSEVFRQCDQILRAILLRKQSFE